MVNDDLRIDFDVINVLSPRSLKIEFLDLSGQIVHNITNKITAGRTLFSWNGNDMLNARVKPGIYIVKISLDSDYPIQPVNETFSDFY